jgi:hypothetical protein
MKTIQAVPIWDNGQTLEAKVINTYAINVTLGVSANFYYALYSETTEGYLGQMVAQGNLNMGTEAYLAWGNNDDYAWDFVAEQLNLTITGDYVPPVPNTTTTTTEAPNTTTTTEAL